MESARLRERLFSTVNLHNVYFSDVTNRPSPEKPGLFALLHFGVPYIASIVGFLVSLLIVAIFPAAREASTLIGRLTSEPFWLPEIMAGLFLGWFAYKTLPSKIAFMAWLIPGLLLLWSAWSWQRNFAMWDSTWDTYFGSHCAGSECIYQLFLTAPFYSSVFYSIGALSNHLEQKKLGSTQ